MVNASRTMVVVLLFLLITSTAGCGAKPASLVTPKTPITNISLPEKVTFGVVNSKTIPPQVVYGFNKDIYQDRFPNVAFELELSAGHNDVATKMGDSSWDFMYLPFGPAIEFVNYRSEAVGKYAEYTVLAGAQFSPSTLLSLPEIKDIMDLDGKTVGITNKNNDKEMLLNKVLAQAGLKTEALGGTVKVVYAMPARLFQDFQSGKIQAFYPQPSMVKTLVDSGFNLLSDGRETIFEGKQNFAVFAVSNKFLQAYPDLVKEMVRLHVELTALSKRDFNEMVDLTYQLEAEFFKDEPKRVIDKDELYARYQEVETTYDPNVQYVLESYNFLEQANYIDGMPAFEKWADFSLLHEVLVEEGLPAIQ